MSNVKNPKSQNPKSKIPNNKCLRNLKVITNWGRAGFILTFLTFHFGAGNRALEARGTRGGGASFGEPGARAGRDNSPVTLVNS